MALCHKTDFITLYVSSSGGPTGLGVKYITPSYKVKTLGIGQDVCL